MPRTITAPEAPRGVAVKEALHQPVRRGIRPARGGRRPGERQLFAVAKFDLVKTDCPFLTGRRGAGGDARVEAPGILAALVVERVEKLATRVVRAGVDLVRAALELVLLLLSVRRGGQRGDGRGMERVRHDPLWEDEVAPRHRRERGTQRLDEVGSSAAAGNHWLWASGEAFQRLIGLLPDFIPSVFFGLQAQDTVRGCVVMR